MISVCGKWGHSLRVCMLNDNFNRGSGITVAVERLLRTPAFHQTEVHLASCETIGGTRSFDERSDIVPVDRYHTFALMSSGPALVKELLRFAAWARSMRFDLIHSHHRRLAVLANVLSPLTGIPVLFTGHLTFPNALWFRLGAPRVMTAVSPSVVAYLQHATNADAVHLIHNPVNFPAPCTGNSPRPLRAISVGRLDAVKGYDILIEAWTHVRQVHPEATLDIYGEGSLRDALQRQIAASGLAGSVHLHGFVDDVAERFPDYSFNVLASRKEGFPNAVIEAAAHGLPSLLTAVDGSRDTLPPDLALPNGLPFGDAKTLGNALNTWFASPALVVRDGSSFRSFLEARCSPLIVGEQFISLYKDVANGTWRRRTTPPEKRT